MRKYLTIVSILLVALVLTACPGQQQPEPTEPPAEQPTEAPAEEPTEPPAEEPTEEEAAADVELEPVNIALMTPLTGALSEYGPNFENAARLAVQHLADAGVEVELMVGDSETNEVPAVEAARQLVEIEGAHAVVGAASSGVTIAIAESVTIPNSVPQLSYASTSPLITSLEADQDADFLFRTVPSDALQGIVLGSLAESQGYENVAVFYVNNAYGQGLNDVFVENFDGEVTSEAHDNEPAPTYVSELRSLDESGAEAMVALGYPGQATVYLREAIENDFFENFLFVDGTKSLEIVDAVGAEPLEGQCGTAPGTPDSPSQQAFRDAYEAEYGEQPPLPFMENAYDGVVIAALAAVEAQVAGEELSGTAVRDHLRSVAAPDGEDVSAGPEGVAQAVEMLLSGTAINYQGAAGSQDFDENGDIVTPIEIWCYEDGQPVTQEFVQPGEEVEAPSEAAGEGEGEAAEGEEGEAAAADVPDLGGRSLTIGSDTTYPPFESVNDEGEVIGFDVDLVDNICQLANCEYEFVSTAWDPIFINLANGEFDAVASAVTITEERDEIVDFTVPYYQVGQVVTVLEENQEITAPEDLSSGEYDVGVQLGTTGDFAATELVGNEDRIQRFETIDLAFRALAVGDIDAVVADSPTSRNYVQEYTENQDVPMRIVGGEGEDAWFTTEDYGIAVQPGSDELLNAFNAAIEQLKADGTIDELVQKWEVE